MRKQLFYSQVILVFFAFSQSWALAETIVLKNGKVIEGDILKRMDDRIIIQTVQRKQGFLLTDVDKIGNEVIVHVVPAVVENVSGVQPVVESASVVVAVPAEHFMADGKGALALEQNSPGIKVADAKLEESKKEAIRYLELGLDYYDKKNYVAAMSNLLKALEHKSDIWIANVILSRIYTIQGQHQKSIDCASKSIEIKPDMYEGYFQRGISYYVIKDYAKGIDSLEAAIIHGISIENDKALSYKFLGHSYVYLKNAIKAKENYEAALSVYRKIGDEKQVAIVEKCLKDMAKAQLLGSEE